jgi:hypothetical protein
VETIQHLLSQIGVCGIDRYNKQSKILFYVLLTPPFGSPRI